ncbi:hypothetical protein M409DRAFT_24055 [Zasmidium cellare ATCC 36951]|uniref:Uncharacterized protein n=1 Tax=Zasmidium cellare ATCC 36951 TaxID=1080233 RepID=A0A6A6CJ89_ZASCE|nr:uncharacterized protein M409DRAFT_24055 [Zasmidium cellare ATCC 36951]KAF2165769.1 hypothetical protein M409DRAFT_24055 [Zasmidium cellare ATCC 36951]
MAIEAPDPSKTWRYSATAKRKKTARKSQPRKLRVNHFMKLPPELRNNIYELVLVDNTKPQQIRSSKRKDPALLRFSLIVSVNNLEILRCWLQYIKETCGKIKGRLCVKGFKMEELGKLLPLMQIAYEGMELREVITDHHRSQDSLGTLRSVATLGMRAREEQWNTMKVELAFDEWMLDLTEKKGMLFKLVSSMEDSKLAKMSTSRKTIKPADILNTGEGKDDLDRDFIEDSPDPTCREDDVSSEEGLGRKRANGWTSIN